MYSPKIPERLIPPLYQMARTRRRPMTRIVAEILDAYLEGQGTSTSDNRHAETRPASPEMDGLGSIA